MAEFGFFESVDGDRLYYSDSFNKYFKGFFQGLNSDGVHTGSGVFRNIGNGLTVVSGTQPLEIVVNTGKALVDYHWYEQEDSERMTIENNLTSSYGRYDLVVLRCNSGLTNYAENRRGSTDARTVGLAILTGIPDRNPKPPTINTNSEEGGDQNGNDNIYELPLASIYVPPKFNGVISQNKSCIINNAVAPVIQGILNTDNDINVARNSYTAKMDKLYNDLQEWITRTQNTYDQWFYDVTENLTVGGYVKSYTKYIQVLTNRSIPLTGENGVTPTDYEYDTDDIFIVTFNGLTLTQGKHYTISGVGANATLELSTDIGIPSNSNTEQDLSIRIMKSNISQRQAGTLTSALGDYFLYTNNVVPQEAYGFKIHNPSSTTNPVMCYCNRNLLNLSELVSQSYEEKVYLVNNGDGTITLTGTNDTESDIVFTLETTTREFAFENTYSFACPGTGVGGTVDPEESGEEPYPAVVFNLIGAEDQVVAASSDDTPVVFTTTSETFGNTFKIQIVVKAGATDLQYTISPQLECGGDMHDFEMHKPGEFTYGDTLPTFEDQYVYIWAKEDTVAHNFQLIYYVLSEGSADATQY